MRPASSADSIVNSATEPVVLRPEDQWSLGPSDRGRAIHELIGALLLTTRAPSPREIRRVVSAHGLLEGRAIIHSQAIKQHLTTAITGYFARFAPCDVWDFVGHSVHLAGCEFDLLWRD